VSLFVQVPSFRVTKVEDNTLSNCCTQVFNSHSNYFQDMSKNKINSIVINIIFQSPTSERPKIFLLRTFDLHTKKITTNFFLKIFSLGTHLTDWWYIFKIYHPNDTNLSDVAYVSLFVRFIFSESDNFFFYVNIFTFFYIYFEGSNLLCLVIQKISCPKNTLFLDFLSYVLRHLDLLSENIL